MMDRIFCACTHTHTHTHTHIYTHIHIHKFNFVASNQGKFSKCTATYQWVDLIFRFICYANHYWVTQVFVNNAQAVNMIVNDISIICCHIISLDSSCVCNYHSDTVVNLLQCENTQTCVSCVTTHQIVRWMTSTLDVSERCTAWQMGLVMLHGQGCQIFSTTLECLLKKQVKPPQRNIAICVWMISLSLWMIQRTVPGFHDPGQL